MACASMLVRPKVSATSEGRMATWAARKADGISVAMADEAHLLLQAMPGDEVEQLLAVGSLARSVAGEHDDRVVERARPTSFAAASIVWRWPFSPVRRAACSTILISGLTPHRSLSLATGPGGTTKGSNVALSMPR